MILGVRPFELDDLEAVADFAAAARSVDASVEPFGQRLALIATGPRALLELWRVAVDEENRVHGVAFAALREGRASGKHVLDFYAAVAPSVRRQGLGRALCEPALGGSGYTLRARVREEGAGVKFLQALGFAQTGAQLQLSWDRRALEPVNMPALRIREGSAEEYERLANEAWKGAPDAFATRSDEVAQLLAEQGRVLLFAEAERRAVGYFSAVQLGRALGIEEVAVLPEFRRMGIGRALVTRALRDAPAAVLSVAEANRAARALYRSLGFTQTARRLVFER